GGGWDARRAAALSCPASSVSHATASGERDGGVERGRCLGRMARSPRPDGAQVPWRRVAAAGGDAERQNDGRTSAEHRQTADLGGNEPVDPPKGRSSGRTAAEQRQNSGRVTRRPRNRG